MLVQDPPELAAPLAFETHRLMRRESLLAREDAAQFEEEALDRLEAWTQAATNWHRRRTCQRSARQAWRELQTLLGEILMSEVLTRVRGAMADSHAALPGDDALSTAARRILDGHIRIRDRIWWLLTSGGGSPSDVMIPLDALRRRLASWTDLLLAHVPDADIAARWACDPQRMAEFRDDLEQASQLLPDVVREDLLAGSLCTALQDGAGSPTARWLGPWAFESFGAEGGMILRNAS